MLLNLELDPAIERKINIIFNNTKNKDLLFEELINYQINEMKKGIVNIKNDLISFEKKYNMSSEEFYNKTNNGELDDRKDFIIWAGIYEMYISNIEKVKELE
ncbi:MAG: hypothetical protein A2086_02880 [Spirochaetes bacterium GWD1_27_9]|nr:MAG: hypothetical protein A2Z98_18575 [Spirochaetes bacterium GWB1_27_13]OHD20227.1 MAG: hypothetical protein A2Y34_04815 [Spirochaetes bacterium GWC1_27_15]OHD43662.1 MAG: hypothetical protein A2086_02880 [Spirochaetes bacterium GWD1_27_9]